VKLAPALRASLLWVETRRWIVLAVLVAAAWASIAVFADVVRHNGWLFYQGGDETFYYGGGWVVAHGHIPKASVGWGWPLALAPLARVAGPDLLRALPAIVLLQVVVLVPVALYCIFRVAESIAGRRLGYVAAALSFVLTFCAIPLWDQSYHAKYVEQFLPQALGLTAMADFPSMVCVLVAALFTVRALDGASLVDGALAGAAAGLAIAIKPPNALFLVGAVPALLVARRGRALAALVGGLLPEVFALALWKYRGLGYLPVFTPTRHVALAAGAPAVASVSGRYTHLDWTRFHKNYEDLRQLFWGLGIWIAVVVFGIAAAARRSVAKAVLLVGWAGAFLLVKGSSDQASLDNGTLLRLLLPGLPPLAILVAIAPLLVLRSPAAAEPPPKPPALRTGVAAIALVALLPLVVFAVLRPHKRPNPVTYGPGSVLVPVDRNFHVRIGRAGGDAILSWDAPSTSAVRVFYRVFRSMPVVPAPDPTLPPGVDGVRCHVEYTRVHGGASDCWLEMPPAGVTRATRFVDRPPAGRWVYRVALAANWLDDVNGGDLMLLSPPVRLAAAG
jgi:hypothetical protein